ncbi:MAG: 50S ribosomal protein L11 methyltransferase [Proteobacteria bacterium]|nr:50S ribosomal protein L11 methyltransferase [Pseudomonadota bacterium]
MPNNVDYDYFEITLACTSKQVDDIEEHLMSLGACSVTFRDADDIAILEPGPGEIPLWQDIKITAMFSKDFDENNISLAIQNKYPQCQIDCNKLQNQIWERVWLQHFKPMQFGKNTWIIPSEFTAIDQKAVNIYLDPGLAFGTGTHATTALCLQWIDANDLQGKNIIDFGCGSGILTIAALKHQAKKVYCTDIDPQAIESTLLNCQQNNVQTGMQVVNPAEFSRLKNLDIIMANILAAPLLSLVTTFANMLKPNGELIMSGILVGQTDVIIEQYNQYFIDFQIKIIDDWALVFCMRKGL